MGKKGEFHNIIEEDYGAFVVIDGMKVFLIPRLFSVSASSAQTPEADPWAAASGGKNSPLTGRKLEQDQLMWVEPPADRQLGREEKRGHKAAIGSCHPHIIIKYLGLKENMNTFLSSLNLFWNQM